jgi:hypothetical protein
MIVSSGLKIGSTETIDTLVSIAMKDECDSLSYEGNP